MRPRRERTSHTLRWLAFAAGVLLIVIAASMQSTLGEFSLTAAIVTYAVIAIAGLALMAVLRRSPAPLSTQQAPDVSDFGIYVHWPFCASKCPYCDFNSHVRAGGIDEARFLAAFRRELAHWAARRAGPAVTSVFFGGGTPSLMGAGTVGAILDTIASHWRVDPAAEITLEANPSSVEAARFRGYRAAGVNRVSLGVQSFDDAAAQGAGPAAYARPRRGRG